MKKIGQFNRVTLSLSAILALALVAAMAPVASAGHAPIGVWKLNGNLKNSKGAPPKMVKVGSPTFKKTKVRGVTRKVLRFVPTVEPAGSTVAPAASDDLVGEGVRIKNIPKRARKTYTIELLFKKDDITVDYRKIMSLGPNTNRDGVYVLGEAIDLGRGRKIGFPETHPDKWWRVRITRSGATKMVKLYVNGKLILKYKDKSADYTLRKGVVELFKGETQPGVQHPTGYGANVRLWDRVVKP